MRRTSVGSDLWFTSSRWMEGREAFAIGQRLALRADADFGMEAGEVEERLAACSSKPTGL